MVIIADTCGFSGNKIWPGHGSKYIKNDGKNLFFLNSKCKKYYIEKIKAVRVMWTQLYRKLKKQTLNILKKKKLETENKSKINPEKNHF
ncbi:Yrpl24 (nucleomorph) [Hemiselmis andersenii]|uniref:Yrpl24 n=1 Tax=Hemiselmis andersenii TaxID=464988 RepID=A9BKJ2_HEMAN|nr:Yrpl24 [Hemiselmis andersenii]ABW98163.1 Yrpl24 [Hemiselmis andersenii]|mmetsp:Transcript_34184/g.83198  ORF Transcript_34184/g.83198 Transcript_34184/m.83198 type:complete len:89 (-) Transcript_34184:435-701(-)